MGELSQPNLSVRPTPLKLHNLGIHKEQEKRPTGVTQLEVGLLVAAPWDSTGLHGPLSSLLLPMVGNKLKNRKYSSSWEILSKTKENISKKSFLSDLAFFSQNTNLVFVFKNSLFRKRMHFEMQGLISFNTGFQSTEKNTVFQAKKSHIP